MKKNRIIPCLLTAALIAATFAGCGDAAAKTADNAAAQEQQAPQQDKATMAKVVSLDGDQLPVTLADMPAGKGGGSRPDNGTPPAIDGMQGTGEAPADGQTPPGGNTPPEGAAPPDGGNDPSTVSGAAADGNGAPGGSKGQPGQGGGEITFGTDEVIYTLSDDVIVKKGIGDSAAEIDLSELAVDDVIRFTTITDDSGCEVIDSITVIE